jgi:hypothetical protein
MWTENKSKSRLVEENLIRDTPEPQLLRGRNCRGYLARIVGAKQSGVDHLCNFKDVVGPTISVSVVSSFPLVLFVLNLTSSNHKIVWTSF